MASISSQEMFRKLPAVDELLRHPKIAALVRDFGRACVLEVSREQLSELRASVSNDELDAEKFAEVLDRLPELISARVTAANAFSLRRVINASGVVIHTNLGRAPLSDDALEHVAGVAGGYSNLEFDLDKGERGRRDSHAQQLFAQLLGREGLSGTSTVVVNNNAAAVLLALSALASGGEVIISRGELVEIGGSFRIPEIMAQSGAVLREVGTTNRTRVEDYKNAITEHTRLLLRVHRSNFEIVGFTEQPSVAELAQLAASSGIPLMEDLGSGALVDFAPYGIPDEPNLYDSLRAGVSLVTFSGDKLLGGPQAGLIAGDPKLVRRLREHPLFRALRVDKMCYAALEATLSSYVHERYDRIPLLRMIRAEAGEIRQRCEALASALTRGTAEVLPTRTMIGGGAAPGKSLPSFAVSLALPGMDASELARRLREQETPIVARVEDGRVLLDLRTVAPQHDAYLHDVLANLPEEQSHG